MALSFNASTLIYSEALTWNGGSHEPALVTFSFATAPNGPNATTAAATAWASFGVAQRQATRQALDAWGDVSGIHFLEVPDTVAGIGIDLRYQFAGMAPEVAGQAYYPTIGDISLSLAQYARNDLSPGSYGYLVLLHETGHALGLKHPFSDSPVLPDSLNNFDTTVMAYPRPGYEIPGALRAADIEAIQHLYGTQQEEQAFGIRWSWDAVMSGIRHEGDDRAQVIAGTALRDIILGHGGDDVLRAGAGNDVVAAGGGRNIVQGESGTDTLVIDLYRAETNLDGLAAQRDAGGAFAGVSGVLRGPGQHTTFSGIEAIAYADGRLVFDEHDPAAAVTRLYWAVLGRLPDAHGRESAIEALRNGQSLAGLAEGLLGSGEFAARSGQPAADLLAATYRQALGREAGASELSYWQGRLEAGMSRAELLAAFSQTDETRARTADIVAAGIWDADDGMASVARLYHAVLGRGPDAGGLRFWNMRAEQGLTLAEMANQFAQSAEFSTRFAAASDRDFVTMVYVNTLGRAPEAAGELFWTEWLVQGLSRGEMVQSVSTSHEFLALTTASIDNGIVFA